MNLQAISIWEKIFESHVIECLGRDQVDPAHDLAHFRRVVKTSKTLCELEKAKIEIVLPAAWLHDLVNVPKNDPRRSKASKLSAEAAIVFLSEAGYPHEYFDEISHAIEAHSFSANIETRTLEAKIVQDADRLDGLGAIGIARVFAVAGLLNRPLYDLNDPFANHRKLDDFTSTVDHFYVKLFKTVDTLKTRAGREEGLRRSEVMKNFLKDLKQEIEA